MTLTVDEVRNIRFPMARQPNEDGYRASAVDNFIDRLEVSYASIVEENEKLKAQGGSGEADEKLRAERDRLAAELDQLRVKGGDAGAQIAALQAEKAGLQAKIDELNKGNAELAAKLDDASHNADQAVQAENQHLRLELDRIGGELNAVRAQLQQANAAGGQQVEQLSAQLQQAGVENDRLRGQVNELRTQLDARAQEGDTRNIVVTTSADAAPAAIMLVEQAINQVEGLTSRAEEEAQQKRDEAAEEARQRVTLATQQAEEITRRAQAEADQLGNEARQNADRIFNEAKVHAARLEAEANDRRRELFSQLERDRDVLSERVGQLRDFEAQYRASMTTHLQRQIDALNDAEFAPSYRPELLDGQAGATPRLDSLMADDK